MTTSSPTESPTDSSSALPIIPDEVLRNIRNAWIAAAISASLTLALSIWLGLSDKSILGFSAWNSIDAALGFGLAFGIYKKSRTCAVVMLAYFAVSKILAMIDAGKPSGGVVALIFLYYFANGVSGTFRYHQLRRSQISTSAAGV